MKKINWKGVIGWCIVALAVVGCILYFNQPEQKKEGELVVAVNLPLSGPIASFTGPYAKGLEMGVKDELKALNLPESSVRFLMGDNQGQAMVAATLFRQQELNDYDVYVVGTSEMASAVVDNIKESAAFIPIALAERLVQKGNNAIRPLANFNLTRENLYSFIKQKNPKKVAVIAGCPDCQKFAEERTIAFLKENNIDYHEETFEWGFREYRTTALKIQKYNPDLILVNAYAAELGSMIRSLREYGLIKNNNTWASIDLVDLFEPNADLKGFKDIVFDVSEYNLNPDKEFFQNYQKIYKDEPTYMAAYGYDTGRLIVKAWIQSGKVTPETIIAQTPYDGVTGHLVMDPNTRDLISTQILGTLDENGRVIEWKEEQK